MKKTYIVGGFVRDLLLQVNIDEIKNKGITEIKIKKSNAPRDLDYVVTGSSENEILSDKGVERVGIDFPVFLKDSIPGHLPHIEKCEYALARKENSTGDGTNDFKMDINPDITITEDLARRDLGINAMAIEADGLKLSEETDTELIYRVDLDKIIDPFNGMKNLQNKELKHVVSNGKTAFFEDPLRVLRIARFTAKFPDFVIADETVSIIQKMVNEGKIDTLKKERVWIEIEKNFKNEKPSKFFDALNEFGLLKDLFPELYNMKNKGHNPKHHAEGDVYTHTMLVLDETAKLLKKEEITGKQYTSIMMGALYHDIGKGFVSKKLYSECKYHGHDSMDLDIELDEDLLKLFKIDNRLDKTNLTNILNLIVKRQSSNFSSFKKIIINSVDTHQKIHTFDKLNSKTIYKFLEEYCPKPDDLENFTSLLYVAYSDSLGRYSTISSDKGVGVEEKIIEDNGYTIVVQETNEVTLKEKYKQIFETIEVFHLAKKECPIDIQQDISDIKDRVQTNNLTNKEIYKINKVGIDIQDKQAIQMFLIKHSIDIDKTNIQNFVVKKLQTFNKTKKNKKEEIKKQGQKIG